MLKNKVQYSSNLPARQLVGNRTLTCCYSTLPGSLSSEKWKKLRKPLAIANQPSTLKVASRRMQNSPTISISWESSASSSENTTTSAFEPCAKHLSPLDMLGQTVRRRNLPAPFSLKVFVSCELKNEGVEGVSSIEINSRELSVRVDRAST